ncbi:Nn.00g061050.m01.CDS01 [Neocucurbitaria sp. VM-36]
MGRVVKHLLTVTTFLAAAKGKGYNLLPRIPAPPQSSTNPLLSVNANGNLLGGVTDTLGDTTSGVVEGVGGVVSGVGGLLNVTAQTAADILSPSLTHLLTDSPLTVLDGLLKTVLHPHPRDPNFHGWQYWGCFYSTNYISTRTPKVTNAADGMSPKLCISLCVADGVDFAIVINNKCYCSNDKPSYTEGSNQCNTACPSNPGLFCGGTGLLTSAAMSVFRRAISSVAVPSPVFPEPTGWRYSGCFFGDAYLSIATSKGYVQYIAAPAPISASICTTICTSNGRSYTYAALYASRCYCSNIGPVLSLQAGSGQCTSTACQSNTGEACGGVSNYAPYLTNTRSLMITLYVQASASPSTTPQVPDTPGPQDWRYWGCYYGALYLLDTILNGIQVSALLDAVVDMSGSRCVTLCLGASVLPNPTFNFALTLGGMCFCSTKAPTEDTLSPNQTMCNEPCPNHLDQRCGGNDPSNPSILGRELVNVVGRNAKVSGFQYGSGLSMCLKMCSVLRSDRNLGLDRVESKPRFYNYIHNGSRILAMFKGD